MLDIFMHDRADDLPCQILYLDWVAGYAKVTHVWALIEIGRAHV